RPESASSPRLTPRMAGRPASTDRRAVPPRPELSPPRHCARQAARTGELTTVRVQRGCNVGVTSITSPCSGWGRAFDATAPTGGKEATVVLYAPTGEHGSGGSYVPRSAEW